MENVMKKMFLIMLLLSINSINVSLAQTSVNHNTARSNRHPPKSEVELKSDFIMIKTTDINGVAISGTNVSVNNNNSYLSDKKGLVKANIALGTTVINVVAKKGGYFVRNKNINLTDYGNKSTIEIALIKVAKEYSIDGDRGGTIKLENGTTFTFKPGFAKGRGKVVISVSEIKKEIPSRVMSNKIRIDDGVRKKTIENVSSFFAYNIKCVDRKPIYLSHESFQIEQPGEGTTNIVFAEENSSGKKEKANEEDLYYKCGFCRRYIRKKDANDHNCLYDGLDTTTYVVQVPNKPLRNQR